MTDNPRSAELAQHAVDERLALRATLSRHLAAGLGAAAPRAHPRGAGMGSDLAVPDDPALAAGDAQFEAPGRTTSTARLT